MPAMGRFILARGQRTRLTRTRRNWPGRAFYEGRDREDQPIARVCLHHLGDMRIGKRGAAPGGLQERLADRAWVSDRLSRKTFTAKLRSSPVKPLTRAR